MSDVTLIIVFSIVAFIALAVFAWSTARLNQFKIVLNVDIKDWDAKWLSYTTKTAEHPMVTYRILKKHINFYDKRNVVLNPGNYRLEVVNDYLIVLLKKKREVLFVFNKNAVVSIIDTVNNKQIWPKEEAQDA